jgi:predicted RecA/RadA family phage recombinase
MKNFVQPAGCGLPIVLAASVTSGQLVIQGAIMGVAASNGNAGDTVAIAMEGVFDLAKVPADALTAGMMAKVVTASGLVGLAVPRASVGGTGRRRGLYHRARAVVPKRRRDTYHGRGEMSRCVPLHDSVL